VRGGVRPVGVFHSRGDAVADADESNAKPEGVFVAGPGLRLDNADRLRRMV
jgi:hypothetical protein